MHTLYENLFIKLPSHMMGLSVTVLCTPCMGVNLWGESPLYANPANISDILAKALAEGKDVKVTADLI